MEQKLKILYALSMGVGLGFSISILIVIVIFAGANLDKKYNSSPWFIILSIFFAFLLSFFLIYYFLLPFVKKEKK
jgi:uncharacterized BrkB/YihY/UPF0761 family membrane protein